MNVYGVVMAGGGGTRFWPLSRKQTPKQLLNLSGKDFMINETLDRLSQVVARENIFIVTNAVQANRMQEITNGRILNNHILSEPVARNTAACIGYAAMKIANLCDDAIMIVSPSDAYIKNDKEYAVVLQKAIKEATDTDSLVTIGISPTFPSTGYGYIHFEQNQDDAKKVLQFVEKPNVEDAQKYIDSGDYVWNSGIFVWKVSVILEKFKIFLPDIYADLEKIAHSIGSDDERKVLNDVYSLIRSISIDYGIMEKASDIKVVPGEFGWSDVGSLDMLDILHDKDSNGNITIGNTLSIESNNSVIYSSKRLVATIGIENLIVVETDDAVLVCQKNKVQDVKKIVDQLSRSDREDLI